MCRSALAGLAWHARGQALPQIGGVEEVGRSHADLALDDGRHAGAAAACSARVENVDARLYQHVDKGSIGWPRQVVSLPVKVDVEAY